MEEAQNKKTILVFEIPKDLHQQVKIRATKRNISMKLWICRAIMQAIKKEEEYE